MSLFGFLKRDKLKIEDIACEDYNQHYLSECKDIWSFYVPKVGQSTCLQGELLRELEIIHREAVENENKAFDWQCEYFCEFIYDSLESNTAMPAKDLSRVKLCLNHFLDCGKYAKDFYEGNVPLCKLDENMLFYKADNLYDIVADAIGLMHSEACGTPLPYEKRDIITR